MIPPLKWPEMSNLGSFWMKIGDFCRFFMKSAIAEHVLKAVAMGCDSELISKSKSLKTSDSESFWMKIGDFC